jgi:hypothetical protein
MDEQQIRGIESVHGCISMVGPDRGVSYGGLVGEWTSLVVWDGAVGFMSFGLVSRATNRY